MRKTIKKTALIKSINKKATIFLATLILISGCSAKMVLTPEVNEINLPNDFYVTGMVEYQGNKQYLPRTIKEDDSQNNCLFIYDYQILYGKDKTPQAIPLFNPLTLVGFPIGENTIVITGQLKLLKGEEVIKKYSATCGFERTRNLFYQGETFSELRKKGLLQVRNNLEKQMYQDQHFLLNHIQPSNQ